jgi:hypothetical protein
VPGKVVVSRVPGWLVTFMDYDLGYIDLEEKTPQPLDNPFGPKVLPMSQEQAVTHVSGSDRAMFGSSGRTRTYNISVTPLNLTPSPAWPPWTER